MEATTKRGPGRPKLPEVCRVCGWDDKELLVHDRRGRCYRICKPCEAERKQKEWHHPDGYSKEQAKARPSAERTNIYARRYRARMRANPPALSMHVAAAVRKWRKSLGWTQTDLGRFLGLTYSSIQKREVGERVWTLAEVRKMVAAGLDLLWPDDGADAAP
jgi:ribosome-binding protein aMBF1 (putative translation factor)